MKRDLINKPKLLETLKEWGNYNPETEYGQGYSRAIKDIIKLIETATPVNAFELLCDAEQALNTLKEGKGVKHE